MMPLVSHCMIGKAMPMVSPLSRKYLLNFCVPNRPTGMHDFDFLCMLSV